MHSAERRWIFYLQHSKMQVRFLTCKTIVKINSGKLHPCKLLLILRKSLLLALPRLCYAPWDTASGYWDSWKSQGHKWGEVSVYLAHSFKNLPIWNSKRSKAAAFDFKRVSVAVFLSGEVSPIFNFIWEITKNYRIFTASSTVSAREVFLFI